MIQNENTGGKWFKERSISLGLGGKHERECGGKWFKQRSISLGSKKLF